MVFTIDNIALVRIYFNPTLREIIHLQILALQNSVSPCAVEMNIPFLYSSLWHVQVCNLSNRFRPPGMGAACLVCGRLEMVFSLTNCGISGETLSAVIPDLWTWSSLWDGREAIGRKPPLVKPTLVTCCCVSACLLRGGQAPGKIQGIGGSQDFPLSLYALLSCHSENCRISTVEPD